MYTRGGIWTNAEDEILKAAVSKYGLTQWLRCSSLLNRKTAKQCKSRWLNWLSPRVNKSEWSAKEDEKLLSLAKILPNQWQTIAPIIGRTPNQCVERYQRLLDDVNFEEAQVSAATTDKTQAALLKVNSQAMPELIAARPDALEMDDEEREMISEARARLANTQGQKAKRKNRERMLAQSRRVALLQKRRELKNVGLGATAASMSSKKKKSNQMDYNEDIAFEVKATDGLYDTSSEDNKDKKMLQDFRSSLQKKRKLANEDDEKQEKKHDKKEKKKNEKQQKSEMEEQIFEDKEAYTRQKLTLSSSEKKYIPIDQLVRQYLQQLNISFDEIKLKETDDETEYLRTKLLESQDARLQRFSKELIKFSNLENALSEARRIESAEVNQEQELQSNNDIDKTLVLNKKKSDEISQMKKSLKKLSSLLKKRFQKLPPPKNDFEIIMDEDSGSEETENQEKEINKPLVVSKRCTEDKGKLAEQLILKKKVELQRQLNSRSLAIQKHLPIPVIEKPKQAIKQLLQYSIAGNNDLQELLDTEMVKLIISDYLKMEYNEKSLRGYDNLVFDALLNDEAFGNEITEDLEPDVKEKIINLIVKYPMEISESDHIKLDIKNMTEECKLTEKEKAMLMGKFLVGDTLKEKMKLLNYL